eukprot:1532676-Rhodomonas_salina.1
MSEATLTPRGDVTRDEEDLKAMQRQFKHHAEDLEKLRVKLQQEHPKLEKGLLANDLIEAKSHLVVRLLKFCCQAAGGRTWTRDGLGFGCGN